MYNIYYHDRGGDFMGKKFKYLKILHGLGVPQEAECVAILDEDAVVFVIGGTEFRLDFVKITGVDLQKTIDSQIYSQGSFTGGLVGGALFGVAGAVIGSAPKKRVERKRMHGVLIEYTGSGEDCEYILLADKKPNATHSKKLGKKLRGIIKKNGKLQKKKKVEL